MYADEIMVLEKGKNCCMGTHKQLIEKCEVYKELYNSQLGHI